MHPEYVFLFENKKGSNCEGEICLDGRIMPVDWFLVYLTKLFEV